MGTLDLVKSGNWLDARTCDHLLRRLPAPDKASKITPKFVPAIRHHTEHPLDPNSRD